MGDEKADSEGPMIQPASSVPALSWLPTMDGGALRRSTVTSFRVERLDGEFKSGSKSSWTIRVQTAQSDDPVSLRPIFLSAAELCEFVDAVFPGAVFTLLPPNAVTESPDWEPPTAPEGVRQLGPTATQAAAAINQIIEAALAGDAYTPEWRNTGQGSNQIS